MDDAGLTPTTTDASQITQGIVPESLRVDTVHFNAAGYTVIGKYVYKCGQLLGYW